MSRRGNGEGTLVKLSNGHWLGRVSLGKKVDGIYKRVTVCGKTRGDVMNQMLELTEEIQSGYFYRGEILLVKWLSMWLELKSVRIKPSSFDSYESLIRLYIIPAIGHMKIGEITQSDIQTLYNSLYNQGKGLSSHTIRTINCIIQNALNRAVDQDLIRRNVGIGVELPRLRKPNVKAFTIAEQNAFFEAAKDSKYFTSFLISVDTGLRCSELLALKWEDIDLFEGIVKISKSLVVIKNRDPISSRKTVAFVQNSTKTKAGKRQVPLTSRSLATLKMMYEARKADFVFPCMKNGLPSLADYSRVFHEILRSAGMEKCGLHVLRHTFVTRCFEEKVHPKVISEMVGHSRISQTMDVYTHVSMDMKRVAIYALDDLYKEVH